jgi:hypothetical protein
MGRGMHEMGAIHFLQIGGGVFDDIHFASPM